MAGAEPIFVETNGIRLSVLDEGARNGSVVLLLHGFPEARFGWRHQLAPLHRRGLRTIVPSLRGYDTSDKPPGVEQYRINELIGDLTGLLDALLNDPAERVSVVGHDWGGILAWSLAASCPERVRKLVVLNAPIADVWQHAMRTRIRQRLKSWYVSLFRIPWFPETLAGLFDGWPLAMALQCSARAKTFSPQDIEEYKIAWSRPQALRAMFDWYRANDRIHEDSRLPIRAPTLLLWGRNDVALTERLAWESVERCDDGTLLIFPEATHWLQHDEPEAINRLIAGFLADEDPVSIAGSCGTRVMRLL